MMRPSARRPMQGRESKKLERMLVNVLDEKLNTNQFCHEGYWLLDKSFAPQNTFIRGECNETASDIDRERYPDTIDQW